jgi:hypothetical protein
VVGSTSSWRQEVKLTKNLGKFHPQRVKERTEPEGSFTSQQELSLVFCKHGRALSIFTCQGQESSERGRMKTLVEVWNDSRKVSGSGLAIEEVFFLF